jgi:hypothetical protein
MENKELYYTPKITEIRYAYKCQIVKCNKYDSLTGGYSCDWENTILTNFLVLPSKIRTLYLTKEDIESCSWDFGNSYLLLANYSEPEKDEIIRIGIKNGYKIGYNFYTKKLKVTTHNKDETILYHGNCPSINEFKYITEELLNIK